MLEPLLLGINSGIDYYEYSRSVGGKVTSKGSDLSMVRVATI